MEKLIRQNMLDALIVKVYAEPVSEINNTDVILTDELGSKILSIVNVYGVQVNGNCLRIESPLTLALPGKGTAPDSCGFEGSEKVKMWSIKKGTLASKIEISSGEIEQLLPQELLGAIDTGIDISDVKYVEGTFSGKIQVWVKVGAKVSVGTRFKIKTGLHKWQTVGGISIAGVDTKVQVKLDSLNKASVKIEACAKFPWPVGKQCARAKDSIKF